MSRHTFLAVPIPEEIQTKIHSYAEEVKPLLPFKKWTVLGDYHITLQFLGASPDERLGQLIEEMDKINTPSFRLALNNVGYFGNPKTPRVFWLGIDHSEQLNQLQERTKQRCFSAGFEVESRPYRPHITLGKRWGGDSQRVSNECCILPTELTGCSWEVNEIILYEIHPGKEPMYVPYRRFKIGDL
ncbi:RNA 2',3'-cyclic phosphodiesterase [Pseudalkalibacillus salsuginis]|uniref:RNA 2',3'-cyclic phosphodiesterase n=1 Tax=Pseudalkalibacillus salsuginis TaxID=2910972 RepID=UPI001F1A5CCF|nr:RNA 2',3'-cyclic phosphodiesterase [Pseudalkalibacillus salsuginis]MCF6408842.1 RNA 2',3'-cyclic phosphodiesterase [Pseudalkalibacillus salsuginis]